MKISDLSTRTGVPVPTIKFYLREGLLTAGRKTGRNQAEYGAGHIERLTLIRALTQDARLSIEQVARSLRAADKARTDFVIAAIDGLEDAAGVEIDTKDAAFRRAKRTLLALSRLRGWQTKPNDVSLKNAAHALMVAMRSLPPSNAPVLLAGGTARFDTSEGTPCAPVDGAVSPESLVFYAEALEGIVAHEIPEDWQPELDREATLRYAVLGTVLLEPFLVALRRMAHVARTRALAEKLRARRVRA